MMGSAILPLCSFSSPGRDQMLGFVQKHRAQSQSPKFFLIHITHFRVIGVPGGCLASSSLFLDEMFSSSYIHFDVPIKGRGDTLNPMVVNVNINMADVKGIKTQFHLRSDD